MPNPKLGSVTPLTPPENGDWGHRSELSLDDEQRAISGVVEDNRSGEVMTHDEVAEDLGMKPSPSEIHPHHEPSRESEEYDGPNLSKDEGESAKKAEKMARKYGEYWPREKKLDFLEDTRVTAEELGWEL